MTKIKNNIVGGGKIRQSNIELLRIIAMFLVMVVHADYFALGSPDSADMLIAPIPTAIMVFIEALSICCVNVFVLISGYFGIRPKKSSMTSFLFQILFFFVLIYGVCLASGVASLSVQGVLQCFCLTPANWFIKAYLLLFILAPVLNAFIEKCDQILHRNVLIGFYLIQTVYGCLFSADFFGNGYSTLSFIGLYLLARYIKIYAPKLSQLKKGYDISLYLLCAALITIITLLGFMVGKNTEILMFTYINPLVIIESVALLLFFSKLKFTSRFINWVAASSFAVYLVHANPNILNGIYKDIIVSIYNSSSGINTFMDIFVFLTGIFILSILIDQVRKVFFEKIRNDSSH